jgi:hypothetical protein
MKASWVTPDHQCKVVEGSHAQEFPSCCKHPVKLFNGASIDDMAID